MGDCLFPEARFNPAGLFI